MGSDAEYGGAARDRACMRSTLTKFLSIRARLFAHTFNSMRPCAADTLEFAEAARILSKSGSTQFPGDGNAIAYAVQDSTSASDMLHFNLVSRQKQCGACRSDAAM